MEFYSLLDNYGYVVYENKKKFWKKKFSGKYFPSDEKFSTKKNCHFLRISIFSKMSDFQIFYRIFLVENFSSLEKYFSANFFFELF